MTVHLIAFLTQVWGLYYQTRTVRSWIFFSTRARTPKLCDEATLLISVVGTVCVRSCRQRTCGTLTPISRWRKCICPRPTATCWRPLIRRCSKGSALRSRSCAEAAATEAPNLSLTDWLTCDDNCVAAADAADDDDDDELMMINSNNFDMCCSSKKPSVMLNDVWQSVPIANLVFKRGLFFNLTSPWIRPGPGLLYTVLSEKNNFWGLQEAICLQVAIPDATDSVRALKAQQC